MEGISYGVPPWRFIWPLVLPYIPMPVIWATAAFEGWECYLASVGLSGIKDLDRFCRLFLIGFIGISFMGLEIENYKRDVFFHPWAIGFGYSTFWGASYEW